MATDATLKRRIKSYFQLDHINKDIEESEKVIAANVALCSWCGRISNFSLEGIACTDQMGRPIMLGVGIIQEIDDRNSIIRYRLETLKPLLSQILSGFQRDKNWQAEIFELQTLGFSGEEGFLSTSSAGGIKLSEEKYCKAPEEIDDLNNANKASRNPSCDGADNGTSHSAEENSWLDDLLYIKTQTVTVKSLLDLQVDCHGRRGIRELQTITAKRLEHINASEIKHNWKKVYQDLTEAWCMPADKYIRHIMPSMFNPMWSHPKESRIDPAQRDILEQQIRLLSTSIDCRSSVDSILSRFERVSISFHEVLLDILSQGKNEQFTT